MIIFPAYYYRRFWTAITSKTSGYHWRVRAIQMDRSFRPGRWDESEQSERCQRQRWLSTVFMVCERRWILAGKWFYLWVGM